MITKTKILMGILIIGLIGGGVVFVLYMLGIIPIAEPVPPIPGTDSGKPCRRHTDCPEGESCISSDKKNWFCAVRFFGCYYRNPENPEEPMLCIEPPRPPK